MQHLDKCPEGRQHLCLSSLAVRARVRFLAYHRIKPHVPPLVRAPVNSFEFQPFAWPPTLTDRRLVIIVYGVDYQGI